MNIQEFRQKYPAYNDMSDQEISDSFHAKYYSDMDKAEFDKNFLGVAQKEAPVEQPQVTTEVPEWGRNYPNLYGVAGAARETLGPVLEAALTAGGAAAGTATAGPMGGVAGAGLGYAGSKNLLEAIDAALGNSKGKSLKEQVQELPGEIAAGEAIEAAGPVIGKGLKAAGKAATQALGMTTGAGPGMVESAVKGGKDFTEAMRGKVSGEEIVQNVKNAFGSLKEQRGAAYRKQLEKVTQNKAPIDISPLKQKVIDYLAKLKVGFKGDGGLDFSNSKLPGKQAAEVEQAFNDILRWDQTPENVTALGLDTLKQRLGNYYTENTAAGAMISELERETKNLILREVPEYAKMTKGYSEATKLIKDIESTLMAGKNYKPDQTLRRISSALRENFEMRKELLNILGDKTGEDITGQVAGYAANQWIPRGLIGKLGAGGVAYGSVASGLNPWMASLLATSSPRAVGEFLNIYGHALRASQKVSPTTYRTLAFGAAQNQE